MNLYDIMMGAQGGQGVNNLANQFGLSQQQTQAAIQAMISAFSLGLQRTAQDPTGFGGLLNQMMSGAHRPPIPIPPRPARRPIWAATFSARSSVRPRSPLRSASRPRRCPASTPRSSSR